MYAAACSAMTYSFDGMMVSGLALQSLRLSSKKIPSRDHFSAFSLQASTVDQR